MARPIPGSRAAYLAALRVTDRERWAGLISAALDGSTFETAAAKLGVSSRTLFRWAAEINAYPATLVS